MTLNISLEGEYKPLYRHLTGWHSFDHSFANRKGEIGFPVRGVCEVYAPPGTGKSTLCYSLAGQIGKALDANIVLSELEEHLDMEYMLAVLDKVGYVGKVKLASGEYDEQVLKDMMTTLKDDSYVAGIIDSIGAIAPMAELDGDPGEANMGRRAKLVATIVRRATHLFRNKEKPGLIFATNHEHSPLGGMARGKQTTGGETLKYMATTRLKMFVKERFPDGSYWVNGTVIKNTFGYSNRPFYLFYLAGWGVHTGLTAIFDCVMYGKGERKNSVSLLGQKMGRLSAFVEKADQTEIFQPFIDTLKGGEVPVLDEVVEEE